MLEIGILIDLLIANPDVGVLSIIGGYLGYEIRFGQIRDIQSSQSDAAQERRILGVAVYKLVQDDGDLDEQEFRQMLWGDQDESFFPKDLNLRQGDD